METTAHPHILNLLAYEPGKPVEELAREIWPIALFAVVVLFIGVKRYRQTLD